MTAEFARMRIAKIRNDFCYSENHQLKSNLNNKENNYNIEEPFTWFNIK